MRPEGILINEWQLGSALNQAVHQGHRGEFGLLLSMMVQDVRYHGSFQLEKTEQGEPLPLRQRFELPEPQPTISRFPDIHRSEACAQAFHQGGLVQSRLQQCITPEPLDIRGEHCHGMSEALANAEPVSRQPDSLAQKLRVFPAQMALADLIAEQRLQSAALRAVA
ncbi:hypothetical protein Fbal_2226 [Ferrimonas balearica DSM 9799]|uniref:Uncharacterized protein n=1 Tax=Ferrimonas balearica (strain DSM 9799 / CCM 4581 / KCTC 23876 / PAT) TaxID=550540 RepID=E1SWE7_FERBD|nr:VC2046/SO_2500 family protein [Ferrimonas balearica]MBY6016906.1 hypothetical protein [Halomonas denitrificans]ADN76429.1 hypothetical protein Fbal_2226 [Ferrimonas balearica DSM 9799]MBW3139330.1 hypothetical protein [Ferrimonas balearica]MBY5980773.1 hypothetical protein [Ferrimonas balearica]MBY6106398.1 hypothetical protein [Ferrimonas balearica]